MTLRQAGLLSGCNAADISRFENRSRVPNAATAFRLSEALQTPLKHLLEPDWDPFMTEVAKLLPKITPQREKAVLGRPLLDWLQAVSKAFKG